MAADSGEEAYKEIVEGRGGRPSLLVRMERAETDIKGVIKAMDRLAYIATALLIATIIGGGSLVARAVIQSERSGSISASK